MGDVQLVLAYAHPQTIGRLFREYTEMLIEGEPVFQEYLNLQNYEAELTHLEEKYGMPEGRLYLAYLDGKAVGCVGLRKLQEGQCECKRLYVRPGFRGKGIGKQLMLRILQDAREIGYREMLLDTLPFLESALGLYREIGFQEIPAYNDSPVETTIYMKLDLNEVRL